MHAQRVLAEIRDGRRGCTLLWRNPVQLVVAAIAVPLVQAIELVLGEAHESGVAHVHEFRPVAGVGIFDQIDAARGRVQFFE